MSLFFVFVNGYHKHSKYLGREFHHGHSLSRNFFKDIALATIFLATTMFITIDLSNGAFFPCTLGEFEKVMQTQDVVEGLHNFREFSEPTGV